MLAKKILNITSRFNISLKNSKYKNSLQTVMQNSKAARNKILIENPVKILIPIKFRHNSRKFIYKIHKLYYFASIYLCLSNKND